MELRDTIAAFKRLHRNLALIATNIKQVEAALARRHRDNPQAFDVEAMALASRLGCVARDFVAATAEAVSRIG